MLSSIMKLCFVTWDNTERQGLQGGRNDKSGVGNLQLSSVSTSRIYRERGSHDVILCMPVVCQLCARIMS